MTAPRPDLRSQAALAAPAALVAENAAGDQRDGTARRAAKAALVLFVTLAAAAAAFVALAALAVESGAGREASASALASTSTLASTSASASTSTSTSALAAAASAGRPGAAAVDERLGDIQSVYAWMDSDATHVNLAMTLSPFDDGTTVFGPGFQYVFHVNAQSSPGGEPTAETLVICQFEGPADIDCWVGSTHLSGNPSLTDGLYSGNRLVRVFAGRRSDPFFFNGTGFENALASLRGYLPAAGGAQCPAITPGEAGSILAKLRSPANDRFADTNVLALVLSIDKRMLGVRPSSPLLSVWGSTHRQ